ncbi:MAG: shikimate kinase [Pseudomonadota bacterium]
MYDTPSSHQSISLIGMPGSGKSTVGVILAKHTGLRFVDTDLAIQELQQGTLQQILDRHGYRYLRRVEEQVLLKLDLQHAVIATGGSVIYSEAIMQRLSSTSQIIYLAASLTTLTRRVTEAPNRGIASDPNAQFEDIFSERVPLYERWADITISSDRSRPERLVQQIIQAINSGN